MKAISRIKAEGRRKKANSETLPKTQNRPLLVIVGPTAVGKTSISLQLASEFNGEIVSADSRLFYRGMDIGTDKPTPLERSVVPHHLIDFCEPNETLTLAAYQRLAYRTIDQIHKDGRLPILVGGTGQYVRAVVEGWGIPQVPPKPELRQALAALGAAELVRWLNCLDPIAAEKLDPKNVRRVIRALEVTLVKGQPISELQRKTPPFYRICQIGLYRNRELLYRRIDDRVDEMMRVGLMDEVKRLRMAGYGRSLPAMSGLGYSQLLAYLDGELSLAEAVERIKFDTHRFARQQSTWFRRDDPAITWFDSEADEMETTVIAFIQNWTDTQHE